MPWNNNNTGGGKGPWGNGSNGGNGGGGPWGGGSGGGGNNGGGGDKGPNDIEDIFRKGQDQFKKVLSGNNGGGGNGGENISNFMIVGLLAVFGAAFWLYNSFYQVEANQLGVELFLGKPKDEVSTPGLHFHLWPLETVEIAQIESRQVDIGGTNGNNEDGLMLSGDQNIVEVSFAVIWEVLDPKDFLFNIKDPANMLAQVSESAMREVVGRRPAQDVFRDERAVVAEEVRAIIQKTIDDYGAGISVNGVTIEDVAPPTEVADAFDEVQRAEQDEDRFVEEANLYSNQKLGQSRGAAARIREDAAAYKNRVVQEAAGEAARFVSVYDEYKKAPDVTRKRMFIETMERVLAGSNKVIIGTENGSGVVPYLPLPEVQNRLKGVQQ